MLVIIIHFFYNLQISTYIWNLHNYAWSEWGSPERGGCQSQPNGHSGPPIRNAFASNVNNTSTLCYLFAILLWRGGGANIISKIDNISVNSNNRGKKDFWIGFFNCSHVLYVAGDSIYNTIFPLQCNLWNAKYISKYLLTQFLLQGESVANAGEESNIRHNETQHRQYRREIFRQTFPLYVTQHGFQEEVFSTLRY